MKALAVVVVSGLMIAAQAAYAGPACCGAGKTGKTEKAAVKPQTKCPVMGGKVNKSTYVDHEGKRVYLCCAGCVSKFKEDADKYVREMEAKGIGLEKAPAAE
jgi:YHS domain-containing protein